MYRVLSVLRFGRIGGDSLAGQRPEMLRRSTLAVSARIITGASLCCGAYGVLALAHGMLLPMMIAVIGLCTGVVALALCRQHQYERAATFEAYGVLLAGAALTVADPQMADFGLATALLAPVHASLLARSPVKKRIWAMLVAVVLAASAAAIGLPAWPEPFRAEYGLLGAATFAVVAVIVAIAASRLNAAFDVYERAQVNAYRHLIEHVQDAVMRFAPDGQVLFASRSSEKLFGCRRYELSNGGLLERIHVLDRPAYLSAFADANLDGKARKVEVRMRRDDPDAGTSVPHFIWVEAALSPVLANGAQPGRYEVVALLRDVTDRKDIETEMRNARKAAEDASSAKSRFLATIGHELRTPLNAIVGFSEMMTSGVVGELSPTHREYAELIRQSGHHLIDVVRMLLDMSRIEAGRFELQTEPFQPEALVAPCLQIVDPLAQGKQVTVSVDVPTALPALVADERACRQILINLLSNAIKFSHDGGRVRLSMRRAGRRLAIAVCDEGIGMSPQAQARIGEPFFQAEDGLARGYEGTGLGLSIVKGLVDLHDGTLEVESTLGKGTTFTVLLPLNGPATKLAETATVTPIRPEPSGQQMPEWRDEQRKAL